MPVAPELILDGTKIQWHMDRVAAWERGERIAPITVDIALTRSCNYGCHFCYAMLQENERRTLDKGIVDSFLADAAEIGVRGISLVGDGESSISPLYVDCITRGSELGITMATATNGFLLTKRRAEQVLPHLSRVQSHRVRDRRGGALRLDEIRRREDALLQLIRGSVRPQAATASADQRWGGQGNGATPGARPPFGDYHAWPGGGRRERLCPAGA